MKRYIRASFDPSMPDWVKSAFRNKYGFNPDTFAKKYGVALSDAKFVDTPTENTIPVYLIENQAYIPGFNDDTTVYLNGRARKLGSIAKSKLEGLAKDIVYIDRTSAPMPEGHGYRDPRRYYSSRYTGKQGNYAGQYKNYKGKWSAGGNRGATESSFRDKSGYVIPDPKDQLARYYSIFPEKLTSKVESIYQRLLDVKDDVLSPERINTPRDYDEKTDIGNAIFRLRDAVDSYRNLLKDMKSFSKIDMEDKHGKRFFIETVTSEIKQISDSLDDAERLLTRGW